MATSGASKRPRLFQDLDKCLNRNRFKSWWSLLLLPYVPFGLILTTLRICMSLQIMMMLLIFPEGKIKRFIARILFGVLGVIVTTEGENTNPKVFVANRLSYIDHIVLHLATDCETVSVKGSPSLPLTSLLPHRTLTNGDDQSTADFVLSNFNVHNESIDYTPLAVQPECLPTNGTHSLLGFVSWPFMLDCTVQPLVVTSYRPWPVEITKVTNSGWWDLLWTLFVPFTYFRVRFLEGSECGESESPEEFSTRLQSSMAKALNVKVSTATQGVVDKWLKDPPRPPTPVARQPSMPNGPVIPMSEFNKLNRPSASLVGGASVAPSSPEVESMVQQVTAVMPQVPHTAIRQDLISTHSVDQTITNILEGRLKYTPIPTLHEATDDGGASVSVGGSLRNRVPKTESGLFGGNRSRSVHLSLQRQMSLEERKKLLLDQARRRYVEKHGL